MWASSQSHAHTYVPKCKNMWFCCCLLNAGAIEFSSEVGTMTSRWARCCLMAECAGAASNAASPSCSVSKRLRKDSHSSRNSHAQSVFRTIIKPVFATLDTSAARNIWPVGYFVKNFSIRELEPKAKGTASASHQTTISVAPELLKISFLLIFNNKTEIRKEKGK